MHSSERLVIVDAGMLGTMALLALALGSVVIFLDSTYFYPPTAFNLWFVCFLALRTVCSSAAIPLNGAGGVIEAYLAKG